MRFDAGSMSFLSMANLALKKCIYFVLKEPWSGNGEISPCLDLSSCSRKGYGREARFFFRNVLHVNLNSARLNSVGSV